MNEGFEGLDPVEVRLGQGGDEEKPHITERTDFWNKIIRQKTPVSALLETLEMEGPGSEGHEKIGEIDVLTDLIGCNLLQLASASNQEKIRALLGEYLKFRSSSDKKDNDRRTEIRNEIKNLIE